jgi:predicted O-methyltransferase YrrM
MNGFDKEIQAVLNEYHQRLATENRLMRELPRAEGLKRRDDFLLAVGEDVGRFLNMMVKSANAQSILEIGTSYGYSTLWLAEAARATGGKVISLEIEGNKSAFAQSKMESVGLGEYVEFRVGDALESIRQATEMFDFVLVDIWKDLYIPSLELFLPKLSPGAYVLADNMLHPAVYKQEAEAYRKKIKTYGVFESVLLPIGSGIELSCFSG